MNIDPGPHAILIGMEASGTIRDEFRALGFNAWSCDLRECESDPRWHLRCDVFDVIEAGWLMGIFHPDCTYLTNAGVWACNDPDYERYPGVGYHQRPDPATLVGAARRNARDQALANVERIISAPIPLKVIENPRGAIGSNIRKADQIIQPPQFGENASKETHLWLWNLPKLRPTGWAAPRMVPRAKASGKSDRELAADGGTTERRDLFLGDGLMRWANQSDTGQNNLSERADRWIDRSRTFPGIAKAMARQWGDWLVQNHGVTPCLANLGT
jgi:hypothetical protein